MTSGTPAAQGAHGTRVAPGTPAARAATPEAEPPPLQRAPVLVVGIGNELLGDEGLGIAAARRLARLGLPDVDVVDGGTIGLGLLAEVAGRQCLLVLDAVAGEHLVPGQVVVLDDHHLREASSPSVSVHQLDVTDALRVTELAGVAPGRVAVAGMVPASLAPHVGLSPVVVAHLDELLDAALGVLESWREPAAP